MNFINKCFMEVAKYQKNIVNKMYFEGIYQAVNYMEEFDEKNRCEMASFLCDLYAIDFLKEYTKHDYDVNAKNRIMNLEKKDFIMLLDDAAKEFTMLAMYYLIADNNDTINNDELAEEIIYQDPIIFKKYHYQIKNFCAFQDSINGLS